MQRRSLVKKPNGADRVSGIAVPDLRTAAPVESGPDLIRMGPRYEEFKAKVEIDRDHIDAAVMEQAVLFEQVGEQHVLACDRRAAAKDRLAYTDSQLARKHRMALDAAKAKATEGIVNDLVMLDPERKRDKDNYSACEKEADLWGNLREAYQQRMRMLRELTTLYATSYFNVQSMGSSQNFAVDSIRQRADEKRKARNREPE
jgi:hypothetical protein